MKKKHVILFSCIAVFILIAGYFSYSIYQKLFSPNVILQDKEAYLFIPTNSDVASVATLLLEKQYLKSINTFLWVANKKQYGKKVLPGKYLLKNGMNNNELVTMLRAGKQVPVNLTFNNIRTLNELSGKISKYLETDSATFINFFDTSSYFSKIGLNKDQTLTLFLPDTYQFHWNTSASEFTERMKKEHDVFWNDERKNALQSINMNEQEVYTLASIVYSETKMSDEAARVAGVYINRLSRNIPLQADPTIIFALKDFTKTRVLLSDLQIESPYNTYLHTGLPPGPICMPPKKYIDAVLHYEKHQYIYFCAKEDFSGYSNFASTLEEHNRNAARYQKALTEWEKKKAKK